MKAVSQDLQAFYRAAQRQEEPKRTDRRAVRAALLGAGAFSMAAHAAASSGALVALIPGGIKVLSLTQIVGYVALGVALGGGAAVVGFTSSRAPAASNPVSLPITTQAVPSNVSARATVPEPASDPEPVSQAVLQSSARRIGASAQPLAPSSPSLMEESRALAEVQAALNAHDAPKALQLLAAQDRAFAAGALGQERSAARVFALCKAGLTSNAQTAKASFLAKYPQSPLAKRVSSACEQ